MKNRLFETDDAVIVKNLNRYLKENFGYKVSGDLSSLRQAKRALVEKKRGMVSNMRDPNYTEIVVMLESIKKIVKIKMDEGCGKRHTTTEKAPVVQQPKNKWGNSFEGQQEYKMNTKQLSEKLTAELNLLLEGDAAEAEVTMAARGIVDELQDIIEKLGKIQNDQLGPLGDEMAFTHGTDEANQFKQTSMSSIDGLLQSARTTKDEMNNALLTLSGQAPTVDMDDDMEIGTGDMEADMKADVELDIEDEMSPAPTMGREKR
jgi:superfamily I DNA and/or RNA helicase